MQKQINCLQSVCVPTASYDMGDLEYREERNLPVN